MKAMAGSGAVLIANREIPVGYDFVELPERARFAAEGDIFGDTDELVAVYNYGPCALRLEDGRVAQMVLTSLILHGAAEAKLSRPLGWN